MANVLKQVRGDLQAKLHGAHLRSIGDVGDASASLRRRKGAKDWRTANETFCDEQLLSPSPLLR